MKGEQNMAFPPIPLIRRIMIVRKLRKCGAVSAETAKTFAEAGVINPNGFKRITDVLIKRGTIKKTADGKYYI